MTLLPPRRRFWSCVKPLQMFQPGVRDLRAVEVQRAELGQSL